MNINRILHIHDHDMVGTLQTFLTAWWMQVELDALLAPVEAPDHKSVSAKVITHPDELKRVNPFLPVMLNNTASLVQTFVQDHPRSHLAVLLRPCELRAMVELRKRHRVQFQPASSPVQHESLIIMSVDCPGTFSQPEYDHYLANQNGHGGIIQVEESYGKLNSYIPFNVRQTCQLCDTPGPMGADITVGTIGIAPQGDMLIIARDEFIDTNLKLQNVTDGMAAEHQVVCREMMVGKLVDQRTEKRNELIQGKTWQMEDMNTAFATLARCTLCADCLDACPLYSGELTGMLGVDNQKGHSLLFELVRVSRWLASCSGCGMCRESCEQGVPLTQVVTTLSHRIQHELHYTPGDPAQPLPWTVGSLQEAGYK